MKSGQEEVSWTEDLHAFSEEQVIHDYYNIFHYISLEHAWYTGPMFSLLFSGAPLWF